MERDTARQVVLVTDSGPLDNEGEVRGVGN